MKAFTAALSFSSLLSTTVLAAPRPHDGFPHEGFIGIIKGDALVASVPKSTATTPAPPSLSTDSSSHASGGEEYVVIFNASHPAPPEVEAVLNKLELSSNHSDVKYTFNNAGFKGFVASMQSHCLDALANMTEVSTVEQSVSISSLASQTRGQSPWGLERISSTGSMGSTDDKALAYTYSYDSAALGAGVDIYIVDTGVNVNHAVFGGRAQQGFSFEADNTDGDGHGTHVAGTAAGALFGVASGANIFAVKVLGADGSGSSANTIAGMDWVIQHNAQRKTQPGYVGAVMSMSWGLSATSDAITTAINSAAGAGIHVSVAAGNSGKNSCGFSPSNTGGSGGPAVAVGSIGITGAISSFSNTGSCNDVYAPGENVLSAWNTSNNTINYLSGTSMATPHVTGVMAYLMVQNPNLAASPAAMKAFLKSSGLGSVATGKTNSGDSQILVNNGIKASLHKRANGLGYTIVEERTDGTQKINARGLEFDLANEGKTQLRY